MSIYLEALSTTEQAVDVVIDKLKIYSELDDALVAATVALTVLRNDPSAQPILIAPLDHTIGSIESVKVAGTSNRKKCKCLFFSLDLLIQVLFAPEFNEWWILSVSFRHAYALIILGVCKTKQHFGIFVQCYVLFFIIISCCNF